MISVADLMPASSPAVSSITSTLNLLPLGPADVHAQQHARPVAALGAAGAGMDFDIGVVAVGLARQQRFDLAPLALGLQPLELRDALLLGRGIVLRFAEFDQRRGVVELALELGERAEPVLQHRALAHQLLRGLGIVPEVGIFDRAFSSASRRVAVSTSKMPPQQPHGLLDVFDKLLGFGAHGRLL